MCWCGFDGRATSRDDNKRSRPLSEPLEDIKRGAAMADDSGWRREDRGGGGEEEAELEGPVFP